MQLDGSQEVEGQEGEQTPDTQPPEHSSGEEAADAMEEEAEAEEAAPEPEEPSLEAQRREQQAAAKRINTAKSTYAKKLVEILGAEFEGLLVCPLCSHEGLPFGGIAGFLIPQATLALPPEAKNDVREAMGEEGEVVTKDDPYSRRCETCDGAGYAKTGSRMNRERTIRCLDCDNRGWIPVGDERRVPANREQVIPPSPSPVAAGNGREEAPPPSPDQDLWGRDKNHPDYGVHPMYVASR